MDEVLENTTVPSNVDGCESFLNDSVADCSSGIVWGDFGGIITFLAFIILSLEILTFYGTVKMKRLPFATRFLFGINLFMDCIFMALLFIATPLRWIVGDNDLSTDIGSQVGRLTMASSWLCMAMLSMERLFCVAYPHRYMRVATKKRVMFVTLTCLTTVLTAKLCTRYFIIPYVYKKLGYSFEEEKDADILTYILGSCMLISLICNAQIVRIVVRHKRQVLSQVNSIGGAGNNVAPMPALKSTNAVWVLIIFFIILYLPWLFIKVLRSYYKHNLLRSTEFMFMVTNCITNLLVYAWRLQECRYHILALFGRCSSGIGERAERMRINVFSINIKEPSTGSTNVNIF